MVTTSIIYIALAVAFGFLVNTNKVSLKVGSLMFVPLVFAAGMGKFLSAFGIKPVAGASFALLVDAARCWGRIRSAKGTEGERETTHV